MFTKIGKSERFNIKLINCYKYFNVNILKNKVSVFFLTDKNTSI